MELPELPEPVVHHPGYSGVSYTAAQMTEYARLVTSHLLEMVSAARVILGPMADCDPAIREWLKGSPSLPTFRSILEAQIAKQQELIARMDYPPNVEMWTHGIMTDIRQERLDVLRRLLDFEPHKCPDPGEPAIVDK